MTTTPSPCSFPPCDDEPCDRHEREQSHAEGNHELCGSECTATAVPLSQERWAEIHSERYTVRSLASADVALDDVLAELDRVRAERAETNSKLVERDVALKAAAKRIAELEGGALTVFRARRVVGDRGATLGHYRTREQARDRCIAALRNESPTLVPDVIFSWVDVDGTEVLGVSTPTEPCPDVTDYVVTEIAVSDANIEAEVR